MPKKYYVSYEPDADLLEVHFDRKGGYYSPVGDGTVMLRFDNKGQVIGFAIDGLSDLQSGWNEIELQQQDAPSPAD